MAPCTPIKKAAQWAAFSQEAKITSSRPEQPVQQREPKRQQQAQQQEPKRQQQGRQQAPEQARGQQLLVFCRKQTGQ
jgi:hypothetical protein